MIPASVVSETTLRIAAAANLRLVMPDLVQAFVSENRGTPLEPFTLEPIFGASGSLATQMRQGAPFDVFLSADVNAPDSLVKWQCARGPVQTYAYGRLAVWSPQGVAVDSLLECLQSVPGSTLGLADTSHAPYGRLAYQALAKTWAKPGMGFSKRTPGKNPPLRLVFGESLAQVMHFAVSGQVDWALVSVSLLKTAQPPPSGRWMEVAERLAPPLAQGMVQTTYGESHAPKLAHAWMAFLLSPKAADIWRREGYTPAPTQFSSLTSQE